MKNSGRFVALAAVGLAAALTMPAAATTYHVDGANGNDGNNGLSWPQAFATLQKALLHPQLAAGDQIWVAAATYYPDEGTGQTDGDREASFQLVDAVTIYGGFLNGDVFSDRDPEENITTLSGDIDQDGLLDDDNSYHVVTAEEVGATAVLNGFRITAGNANDPIGIEVFGGGMLMENASPLIVRCTFSGNFGTLGGAIGISPLGPANSSPYLVNCSLIGNTASHGGGIHTEIAVGVTMVNCVLSGNAASGEAGALFFSSASGTLINCTLSQNSAGDLGGGIHVHLPGVAQVIVQNCILWGNQDKGGTDESAQIANMDGNAPPEVTVTNSCIQGLNVYTGNNNIGDDPLFAPEVLPQGDPGHPRLLRCSPCIDAGNDADVPDDLADVNDDGITMGQTLPWDLDKNPRIADVNPATVNDVDMGAYEFVPDPCPWDLNDDCCVDELDAQILLDAVGTDPGGPPDFDCDGDVDRFDHRELIKHFGPCPNLAVCPGGCGGSSPSTALNQTLPQIGFADVAAYEAWVLPASESEAFVCACVLQALLEAQP